MQHLGRLSMELLRDQLLPVDVLVFENFRTLRSLDVLVVGTLLVLCFILSEKGVSSLANASQNFSVNWVSGGTGKHCRFKCVGSSALGVGVVFFIKHI